MSNMTDSNVSMHLRIYAYVAVPDACTHAIARSDSSSPLCCVTMAVDGSVICR